MIGLEQPLGFVCWELALQPMAAESWLCWRVLDGPEIRAGTDPPRTAAPAAKVFRLRPRTPCKQRNRRRAALIAAVAGAVALIALMDAGRFASEARALLQESDRIADFAGFGLHQVSISGHRFTPDAAIFDALDLANVRSLLHFDSAAVRERIERLPWVETASISRIIPGQVSVQIVERTPFAVWQRAGREMLIDATGRVLPAAGASHEGLPRVAGEGALTEAAEILALVGGYLELSKRLEVAERVGERRWTLRLTGGPDVHLPAGGVREAVARLMAAHSRGRLLDPQFAAIDMRSDETITVRRRYSDDRSEPAEPRHERAAP
jgi:cell division protein FtsQ